MGSTIVIVGVGTQGSMIAFRNAVYGKTVVGVFRDNASREKCQARVEKFIEFYIEKGRLTLAQGDETRSRITYADDLELACKNAYMVIENVPEILSTKQEVFRSLDRLCPPDTLLSSNTSSLLMTEICKDISEARKEKTFQVDHDDPVRNDYLEMMWNAHTAEKTKQAAIEHYRDLGFEPIITERELKGYSVNRVWRAVKKECLKLWANGCVTPSDFDRGWMMEWHTDIGPFKLMDLIGLDTILNIEYSYYNASGSEDDKPPLRFEEMVRSGDLGMKSGKGFYDNYDTKAGNLSVGNK